MIALETQILIALGLDLFFGDPRWFPHPVKFIGRFAIFLETPMRRTFKNPKLAGIATALLVICSTGLVAGSLLCGAAFIHPLAADLVGIILLYTCVATRDLARHSMNVYRALKNNDLPEARQRVAFLVGRDTDQLNEPEVVRATVESVAENIVDGITAPLFFAFIGGPIGALVYKAVNTLDSTFGYRNEKYLQFGWASARIDDLCNFIPARLTAWLIPLAALLVGLNPVRSFKIYLRDRKNHPSPNSGHAEAAAAGALGVQLGGTNYYLGQPSEKPKLGEPEKPLAGKSILQINTLMFSTVALFTVTLLLIRGAL